MNDAIDFLSKNSVRTLATVGLDGKPKLRPFTFFFEKDGKLWFETSSTKQVYKELLDTPYIEFCASGPKMSWIRLSGKVNFSDNLDIKRAMFEKTNNLSCLYKNPENPVFKAFSLTNAKAVLYRYNMEPEEFSVK